MEYNEYPPQDFIAYINRVMAEKAPPHFRVDVQWRQVQPPPVPQQQQQQQQQQDLQDDGMYIACDITARFTLSTTYIVLQRSRPTRSATDARLCCPHCLCAPCVIALPPDWLRGQCDPHDANAEKRCLFYRKFWGLLRDLGLWDDPEYVRRKERRTARDDRREIMPNCVIIVSDKKC